VAAWSAGLRPDIYVTAMDGGEAFFVATGTPDGELTVLGFSTHWVDDAQDGASVYVRGRAARRGSARCCCGTRKTMPVLMVPTAFRFRRRWRLSSFTKPTGSKNLAEERRNSLRVHSMLCVFMRKVLPRETGRDQRRRSFRPAGRSKSWP
jgi:hypothetical protein